MLHRREIDGLRSLAILPVLFYHAGFAWMPGGFFGVEVVFVISGFLITAILVSELNTTGRISISGFYERRARRILPALFMVIFVSIIIGWFVMFTDQFKLFLQSVVSILYFGSNYFFLGHTGYFDADIDLNPMIHTWSLAIEEQFYVFFPIILWLLWRFVGKKYLMPVLAGLAALSLAAAVVFTGDPSNTFYLLQFRAWELIVGALVALVLAKREFVALSNQWVSALGFLAIVASMFLLGNQIPHPGFITLIPILGSALVIAFAGEKTWVRKLLSTRILVGIGLISYSAYLWHQPIFSFFRIATLHEPKPTDFLPLIALSIGLAYLSWRFIENPIRNRKRFSRRWIFVGSAAVTAVALAVSFVGTRTAVNESRTSPVTGIHFSELTKRIKVNRGLDDSCNKFVENSTACSTGENPEVLLWGDSYAMHLAQALESSSTKLAFSQQTFSACAPVLGLAHQNQSYGLEQGRECIAQNDAVFAWLKTHKQIRTVILASPWDDALNPAGSMLDRHDEVYQTGTAGIGLLRVTISELQALGKRVVVVAPAPKNSEDTGMCLAKAQLSGLSLAECNFLPKVNLIAEATDYLEQASTAAGIFKMQDLVCKPKVCEPFAGETFIYRDRGHFSIEGSKYLGEQFDLMRLLVEAAN
jgi:peptidoglycan/LPS O-acetylase OafA/YrhL